MKVRRKVYEEAIYNLQSTDFEEEKDSPGIAEKRRIIYQEFKMNNNNPRTSRGLGG